MKRFLSILLALALALTLGIPALAAEHRAGDTYIRILGSSGARTVGVRTTHRPRHLRSVPADRKSVV